MNADDPGQVRWLTFFSTDINFPVPVKAANFLTGLPSDNSQRYLLHKVKTSVACLGVFHTSTPGDRCIYLTAV